MRKATRIQAYWKYQHCMQTACPSGWNPEQLSCLWKKVSEICFSFFGKENENFPRMIDS